MSFCPQLYGQAGEALPAGTFRSKTHYKQCLTQLRRQQRVRCYTIVPDSRAAVAAAGCTRVYRACTRPVPTGVVLPGSEDRQGGALP